MPLSMSTIETAGGRVVRALDWTRLEQDDTSVVHLPVVVVHELLDRLTVVHVGEVVAPGPEGVTDLLDLSLDCRGLSQTQQQPHQST